VYTLLHRVFSFFGEDVLTNDNKDIYRLHAILLCKLTHELFEFTFEVLEEKYVNYVDV
jgi:hypothetical protein